MDHKMIAAPAQTIRRSSRIATRVATAANKGLPEVSALVGEDNGNPHTVASSGFSGSESPSRDANPVSPPEEDDSSFIQSSPLTSPPSSLVEASPPTIYTPAKLPKSQGITNISIEEADVESDPLPGPDLTALVEAAKDAGEIPLAFQSGIFRRVNNVWLVPQNCVSCHTDRKTCDRGNPCSSCEADDCNSDGFMVRIPRSDASTVQIPFDDTFEVQDTNSPSSRNARKRKSKDADFDQGPRARKPKKAKVVSAYYNTDVQAGKPEPFGQPPVWSTKRQPLCESLPYYHAYQSGAYQKNGIVYGFLCDKEASKRSKFDENIMIATCGGGKSEDESGSRVQLEGVKRNSISSAFTTTMKLNLPVAVIAGQGNPISPCRLPAYYCVLGWFHITDVWCEMSTEKTLGSRPMMRWLVRLEKIDLTTTSWWAPKGTLDPPPAPDFKTKAEIQCCSSCNGISKTIYNTGWTCLNNDCLRFFEFESEFNHDTLEISQAFIRERTAYSGVTPGPITPPVPTLSTEADQAGNPTAHLARAIVCPKCHGCIQKLAWNDWKCDSSGCGYVHAIRPPPISVGEAVSINKQMSLRRDSTYHDSIKCINTLYGGYDSDIYQIPDSNSDICGFIVHMKSNALINQQPGGPNELFKMMQDPELNLRRGVIRAKEGSINQVLTNHYAANWGAPYKYHVKNESTEFEKSPEAVILMLSRLSWAAETVASDYNKEHEPEPSMPLNEILTIGYKADNKIGYHDDGEKELGPTVASLSLGCSATMTWRPTAKAWGDQRPSKNPNKSVSKPARPCDIHNPHRLKIVLRHGDMVVMHGHGIQRNYEHAVDLDGELRFAITGRHSKIPLLDPKIQDEARRAGTVPEHRRVPKYDGDENAKPVEDDDPFEHLNRVYVAKVDLGEGSLEKSLEQARLLVETLEQRVRTKNELTQ